MSLRTMGLALLFFVACIAPSTAAGHDRQRHVSPCKISYPSDTRIDWECRPMKKGETPESLFGGLWLDVLRFNRIDRRHLYPGFRIRVPKDLATVDGFTPLPATYPKAESEPKYILIDLSEQFLGAYEYGLLVFSFPISSGDRKNPTPTGEFQVTAFSRNHVSSIYKIEKTCIPYPMHYALRFFVNRHEVAFWLHGRDVPGYPASHGCVGLYDEEMQKKYYGNPATPFLEDSKTLYEWAISTTPDNCGFNLLKSGPKVEIVGTPPL